MPRSHARYPTAFRQQMVDLVRAGRSLRSPVQRVRTHLSKPSATGSIRMTWATVGVKTA